MRSTLEPTCPHGEDRDTLRGRVDGRGAFEVRAFGALGALVFATMLVASPLHAAPPAAPRLRVTRLTFIREGGADRCPGEGVLRAAVADRLGYDPFREDAARSMTARLTRTAGVLRGELTLTDETGNAIGVRRLKAEGDDCEDLVTTLALAISVALDPDVLSRADRARTPPSSGEGGASRAGGGLQAATGANARPAPRASSLPPPDIVAAPLPAALEATPAAPEIHGFVALGGLVAVGAAPTVNGGFTARLGIRYRAFSAAIEGRADVPATAAAPSGGAVSGALYVASLVPCFHARVFAACALGTLGGLRGAGSGVPKAHVDLTLFRALGVRAGVEIPVSRMVFADLHADFAATISPTTLRLDGRDVWTTPSASGAVGAAVLVRFP